MPVGQLSTDASDHLLLIVGRAQVCLECGSVAVTLDAHKVGGFVHTLKNLVPETSWFGERLGSKHGGVPSTVSSEAWVVRQWATTTMGSAVSIKSA